MAAGIAHEINTPIQFISDNVYFLADAFRVFKNLVVAYQAMGETLAHLPEASVYCEQIAELAAENGWTFLQQEIPIAIQQTMEGLDRVASIVHAMGTFAHPVTEAMDFVDLNAMVQNSLTVAKNEYKYVADVALDLHPNLPPILCELGELSQVFLNLIMNAAHAIADKIDTTFQRGVIRVCTQTDDEHVFLQIEDNGTGIPTAIQSRIFEPFFTTKPIGKGTGQGLALAHATIIKKYRGNLTFQSEPGQGTTFTIALPIRSG